MAKIIIETKEPIKAIATFKGTSLQYYCLVNCIEVVLDEYANACYESKFVVLDKNNSLKINLLSHKFGEVGAKNFFKKIANGDRVLLFFDSLSDSIFRQCIKIGYITIESEVKNE